LKIKITVIFFFILTCFVLGQTKNETELKEINFNGNDAISAEELNLAIMSKESPNWFYKFLYVFSSLGGPAIYFDSTLIHSDISIMKGIYQSRGYFKTKINAKYEIDSSAGNTKLFYVIDEGQPAYIKSFTVSGLNTIDPEYQVTLGNYARIDTTTIYQDAIVNEKQNYILTFLHDHGFMLGKADRPTIVVDTIKNRVDVSLKFTSGKRYKIGEVLTARTGIGADLVDDQLLKDIVGINTGSWYSNYDIQRGQVRLFRTNLFTTASVLGVISDTVGNAVPLKIIGDLGLMHELSPEIITNNEDNTFNLGLGINFIKKNFLGEARKLNVGTSVAAQNISEFFKNPTFADSAFYGYADIRASIEQPFLFGKPINTKIEGYYTSQKRKDQYNASLYGAKLSFDIELAQITYLTAFNTYINIERAEYDYKSAYLISLTSTALQLNGYSEAKADSQATVVVNDSLKGHLLSSNFNINLGMNFIANKTNDIFFPTNGYSLMLLVEDGNFFPYAIGKLFKSSYSHPAFFKTVLTGTFYPEVYSSSYNALGIKFKIGKMFTYYGDKAEISLNQRLYAGGSNSVRGWSTRALVPKEPELNLVNPSLEDLESTLAKGAATGGFFLMEGSVETRNRLIGKIGSALFLDFGNTWNSPKEFKFDDVAVAVGFGLRYYSDFVPFRIDFGFKLYDPNDRRSMFKKELWNEVLQFHLGIGEAF
jgi:outer membrane protein insertion porin family